MTATKSTPAQGPNESIRSVGSAPSGDAMVSRRGPAVGGLAVRPYPSAVGALVLIAGPSGLAAVLWPDDDRPVRVGAGVDARTLLDAPSPLAANPGGRAGTILDETVRQLDEYFAGTRRRFEVELDPVGTEFQVTVWRSLADIGYGETATYGEQAARIGRPTAVRAVGAANGRNPLSIVLPCHRVVGSDGRLTGFAGGLDAKAFLLDHEARHRRESEEAKS